MRQRKALLQRLGACVWARACICVSLSILTCMRSCLSCMPGSFSWKRRKCSKTRMIALPLNEGQIQPAKHFFHEIRWLEFIRTLTLQTRAKGINIVKTYFLWFEVLGSAWTSLFVHSRILKSQSTLYILIYKKVFSCQCLQLLCCKGL